jgi:hypothetical protein
MAGATRPFSFPRYRKQGPTVTDTSIASGSIGVTTNNTSASFDNIVVY